MALRLPDSDYQYASYSRADFREDMEEALRALAERKIELGEDAGSMSVIALSPDGAVGAATTLELFPFAARTDGEASLYAAARFDAPGIRRVTAGELDGLD